MPETRPNCIVCQVTSEELPLVELKYRDEVYHICPQHIPVLIHHPDTLVGKLPGAEKLQPHEH